MIKLGGKRYSYRALISRTEFLFRQEIIIIYGLYFKKYIRKIIILYKNISYIYLIILILNFYIKYNIKHFKNFISIKKNHNSYLMTY